MKLKVSCGLNFFENVIYTLEVFWTLNKADKKGISKIRLQLLHVAARQITQASTVYLNKPLLFGFLRWIYWSFVFVRRESPWK